MSGDVSPYMLLAALLFSMGLYIALTRKNAVVLLLAVEVMLLSSLIVFTALYHFGTASLGLLEHDFPSMPGMGAQIFALVILAVAAAEIAVGLAIVIALYRLKPDSNVDGFRMMKH
ncbi:MAG: NADH-quinone oxidoreductase subunit NuoK [Candidatus Carbobacillus sp.]|nr:NADH-quinone oxidoreductase subunit NuoK [Candidatus Carbobacillus sp.]